MTRQASWACRGQGTPTGSAGQTGGDCYLQASTAQKRAFLWPRLSPDWLSYLTWLFTAPQFSPTITIIIAITTLQAPHGVCTAPGPQKGSTDPPDARFPHPHRSVPREAFISSKIRAWRISQFSKMVLNTKAIKGRLKRHSPSL